MSGPSYEVVPASLHKMAGVVGDARDTWEQLRTQVENWTMESLDLGLIGRAADYPGGYNVAVTAIVDKLAEGVDGFGAAEEALRGVADTYADLEASYYEQFGYSTESTYPQPKEP